MPATSPQSASLTPSSSLRNVVWSPHNSYHSLNTPPKQPPSAASTNAWVRERPVRSILKKRIPLPLADSTNSPPAGSSSSEEPSPTDVSSLLNLPEDLDAYFRNREATPEPADPLCDLDYLAYPVSLVLKQDAKPREIIEGYSVLAARLRTNVQTKTDADASWPLFQPLRKNADAFAQRLVGDLGRALVDPMKSSDCPKSEEEEDALKAMKEWEEEEAASEPSGGLPSPQKSPKKPRKRGMTASQVKYARDLCTICHAAMKLLCIILSVPAVYSVFEDSHLKSILNATLAIPMADHVPTPNARKSCALAILLLQFQRLPETILLPARDRIALALKRGISGELGKEGKKGSANDGLKAVHDLSMFQPKTFVPAFASGIFLRAILQNLLASTLVLRLQACHALGGLAYALAGLPSSSLHATVSDIVIEFINAPSPPSPGKKLPAYQLARRDSPIIRTIRTTMAASDATHIAQSPVWGLSVIASLVVLVGSRMYTHKKASQALLNVLKLGLKTRKASLRHLFSVAWRTVTWAWFQPDYDTLLEDDGEDEKTEPEDDESQNSSSEQQRRETKEKMREAYFQLLHEVVDMQAGLSAVVALVGSPAPSTASNNTPSDSLRHALTVLQTMANSSNPDTINDAAHCLVNMLIAPPSTPSPSATPVLTLSSYTLLPRGLFSSANPATGLLTADLTLVPNAAHSVMSAVRPLFDELPNLEEIRALTRDELKQGWVWDGLCAVWRTIFGSLMIGDAAVAIPEELSRVWESLVVCNLGDDGESVFIERVVGLLVGMLEDPALDFRMKDEVVEVAKDGSTSKVAFPSGGSSEGTSEDSAEGAEKEAAETSESEPGKLTKHELKIKVVKKLGATVRAVLSKDQLAGKPLESLFKCLVNPKHVAEWTQPRASTTPASRKVQRTVPSSLSPSSSSSSLDVSKEVLGPISAWTSLVMSVVSVAEGDAASSMVKAFWGLEPLEDGDHSAVASWDTEVKAAVWRTAINVWSKNEGCWEGAAALLGIPFTHGTTSASTMMSGEEVTRWKEFYEYASGKAADYGVDGASVVDGVAAVILSSKSVFSESPVSTPVSTPGSACTSLFGTPSRARASKSASLIQVSDLLLDLLDITEARDLPSSLVSLVSDTLRVSYPPSSLSISPATWLVQSLTRVVENCPANLVASLVEGLSDNLSVWLSDEKEKWTEDVLDYTFLPLYQHLLLRIQTLPKDLEFLDTISPLLDSVFAGREMPESVMDGFKEAFNVFWSMSPYGKMEGPAQGWPKRIGHCLGLEGASLALVTEELEANPFVCVTPKLQVRELPEVKEVEAPATSLLEASPVIVPVTPKRSTFNRSKIGKDNGTPDAPRTPMAPMNGAAHIPSPQRPRKDSAEPHAPFILPMHSPASPVRRRRRTSSSASTAYSLSTGNPFSALGLGGAFEPTSPPRGSGESPAKRRRVVSGEMSGRMDKENSSPLRKALFAGSPARLNTGRVPAPVFEVVSVAERIAAARGAVVGDPKHPITIVDNEDERKTGEVGMKTRRKMRDRMKKQLPQKKKRDVSPAESVQSCSSSGSRSSPRSSDSSDEERFVADSLLPFPSLDDKKAQPQTDEEPEPEGDMIIVKKRKRPAAEPVVVPAAGRRKRKITHAASFNSLLSGSSTCILSPSAEIPSTPALRRVTITAAEAMEQSKRKRKRSLSMSSIHPAQAVDGDDPFGEETSAPTPLPALSYRAPSFRPQEEDEEDEELEGVTPAEVPSSDDDPHIGQVTPHHIVSPPLAQKNNKVYMSKAKRCASAGDKPASGVHVSFQEVPGSDDDDLMMQDPPSSPSKKVAERRMLQRQNSSSTDGTKPIGQLNPVFRW
ncbi:hypothetical protein H1R20_g4437, partial [Candolleomyces eurysporus]